LGGQANAAVPGLLAADEGNYVSAYVGDRVTYDDNLYKVPADFGPLNSIASPNATRADYYNTVTAGGSGQYNLGRQVFDLNLRIDNSRFGHNDTLNNTAGDANALWGWVFGSHLSGQAGAEYSRALASFAETRYLGRDLVDSQNYFGTARYQVGPRWAVTGELRTSDSTNTADAVKFNNFRSRLVSGGAEYATGINDVFGLTYHYYDGTFPNSLIANGIALSGNYKEYFPQFTLKHVFTDKTSLEGNIGHLKRDYEGGGSYTGIIWRFWLNWQTTDKLGFGLKTWHEIHSYIVSEADYFVSKGVSLSPGWNATEKIALSMTVAYEDQSYIVHSASLFLLGAARHDKLIAQQLNLLYTPRDRLSFNLFVRHERRDSNQPQFPYTDQLANFSATYKIW
jgi:hypothetical protein